MLTSCGGGINTSWYTPSAPINLKVERVMSNGVKDILSKYKVNPDVLISYCSYVARYM